MKAANVPPSMVITAKSVDRSAAEAKAAVGAAVISVPENRWGRCDIKSVGLLPNALAKQAARERGAIEAWFVDELGLVTEGASSNAWIVDAEGQLRTRDTQANILRGVTRSTLLEVIREDYVRTARAKGLSELSVLFRHVLRNAMIPILTGVVVVIPLLFMGALITESFFGIPGLGSYTIDAISQQDFAIVRVMVFLGSVLYVIGLIMTDLSYTLVDPRVRFS